MIEEWRPVRGYEGIYEVSDLGRVRVTANVRGKGRQPGKTLTPNSVGPRAYQAVFLRDHPRKRVAYVHALVLEAFVGARPPGADACHSPDPSTRNNRLNNLRWDTRKGNLRDKVAHGTQTRGECHPVAKLTEGNVRSIFAMRSAGATQQEIGDALGVSTSHICLVLKRKLWAHLRLEADDHEHNGATS